MADKLSSWRDGWDGEQGLAGEPLYLASLLLPLVGNDGANLRKVHDALVAALLEHFGGFTSSDASGLWRDTDGRVYSDTLVRYDVAIAWDKRHAFLNLVKQAGRAGGQHAVYASFNGIAKLIDTSIPAVPAGWSRVEGGATLETRNHNLAEIGAIS